MVQTFLPPRGWEVDDEHDVPSSLALLSLASAAYYSMNQADFSGQTARAAAVPVPDFVYVCVCLWCVVANVTFRNAYTQLMMTVPACLVGIFLFSLFLPSPSADRCPVNSALVAFDELLTKAEQCFFFFYLLCLFFLHIARDRPNRGCVCEALQHRASGAMTCSSDDRLFDRFRHTGTNRQRRKTASKSCKRERCQLIGDDW